MKKLISMCSIIAVFVFMTGLAVAAPYTGVPVGDALQGVLNGITTAPNNGVSSVDVTTDMLDDSQDSSWAITASGASAATMIVELATFAPNNIFGVYQGDKYVVLFAGADTAGEQAFLSIKSNGEVWVDNSYTGTDFAVGDTGVINFGYYLDSTAATRGGLFHSDSALNTDSDTQIYDHMFAYQGTDTDTVQLPNVGPGLWTDNEYILAFEDLAADPDTDWDYTDMVVMVESVQPVPIPGAALLLATGLLGLVGIRRRVQS